MKLDKKTLKSLVVESLQEIERGHLRSISGGGQPRQLSDIPPEEWEQAYEKGPDPVPEEDIANYFKQVGDELKDRIQKYSSTPKYKPSVKSPEEVAKAVEELNRASEEAKSIVKMLEKLKNDLK